MTQAKCLDIVGRINTMWSGDNVMTARITRTEKLDLRLTAEAKHTLAAAAQAQRRTLSDFVLESALGRAEEALADRRVFQLPPDKWEAFVAALDAPPRDLPRLRKLMNEPGVFSDDSSS
jgi:Uncharacterized protein conserved in bacteria